MERLPKEILLVVFSYLSFETKLQCLLVSKDWHGWILRHSLYNELECQSPATLNKAINYFQQNSNLGQSVFKLRIKNCYNLNYNLKTLPSLFPNVKEFELDEARDELITTATDVQDILNWKNIQKLNSTECFEDGVFLIGNILKSPCSYLTCIDILFDIDYHQSFHTTIHRIPYIKKKSELLDNIKNAPYLESLSLDRLHLSMEDLEKLHHFTPNLKSLVLKNITLLPSQEELNNVKSVSLQMLHIQFTNNDTLSSWLPYITQKYTHLESFRFDSKDVLINDNLYEDQLLQLISSNPNLKYYDICLSPFSTRIVNELDRHCISLKNIAIYVTEQNTLEDQCEALLSSKSQKKSINSITMHYYDNRLIQPSNQLNLFQQLTHIEISSNKSQPISLQLLPQFLKVLPNLNSIFLNSPYITCGTTLFDSLHNIKHIEIDKLKIDTFEDLKSVNYFFKFLFPKCPQLETFSLVFKFPMLEEPLEEEVFIEFEKDNPHLFDYLDLHLILDLENLQRLKAVQLRSDSHWYQFLRPNMKPSTIPSYYYHYDTRVGEFHKKFNILPRYFFTTLFLNKKIFVNSIKV